MPSEQRHDRKVIELEHALDYVSKLFIYHADQRLRTFRYFMVYLGAVILGIFYLLRDNRCEVLASLIVLSLLITIIFALLEWRNQELITSAKKACSSLEEILFFELNEEFKSSKMNGIQDRLQTIQIVKITENKTGLNTLISYKFCLPFFYLIILCAHVFLLIWACKYFVCGKF